MADSVKDLAGAKRACRFCPRAMSQTRLLARLVCRSGRTDRAKTIKQQETIMATQALYIRHTAKPGKRDEVKRIWEKYARAYTEKTESQLASFYCYDNNDPDTIVVFGLQDDAHAGDFQKQPWYRITRPRRQPCWPGLRSSGLPRR